jgi:hypothetical protein
MQAPAVEQAGADDALRDVRRQRHAADRRDDREHAAPARALQQPHDRRDVTRGLGEQAEIVDEPEHELEPTRKRRRDHAQPPQDRDGERARRDRAADDQQTAKQGQAIDAVAIVLLQRSPRS